MDLMSKNCIIGGDIHRYCLVCAVQLLREHDTLAHIISSTHKENLESCGYFEKYKGQFIRKIRGVYFCEICSQTFPTTTKVDLHINVPSRRCNMIAMHKHNQGLVRVNNDIVAFHKYLVSEDAWNGLVEDTCVLCTVEFEDSESHKTARDHIINLVKSEVIEDRDFEAVYRKIDDKSHQCLTCNKVFGSDPNSHCRTVEHREAYKTYDESTPINITSNKVNKDNTLENGVDTDKENNTTATQENFNESTVKKEIKHNDKKVTTEKVKQLNGNVVTKQDENKLKITPSVDSQNKNSAAEDDAIYCKNLRAKNYVRQDGQENWCILCDWLLDVSPEEHIRSNHHQALLKLHKERINNNSNINHEPSTNVKSDLFECVDKYQKSNVNIDLINETAFCKKCSKNIDFNTDAIEKHIEEDKETPRKKSQENVVPLLSGMKSNGSEKTTLFTKPVLLSSAKETSSATVSSEISVEDFAKQHGLTQNRADNSFYCHLCSRRLSTTLKDLEKHVESNIHKDNMVKTSLKNQSGITAPIKVPLFETIKTFENIETLNGHNIVINDKYWLNICGFFMIAKKHDTIFCHGCYIDLTPGNVMEHIITSDNHRGILAKCLLITSLPDEFIREIKLDVYHCGYCNIVENDWEDMLEHITLTEHKKVRAEAEKCMENHVPNVFQRVQVKEIEQMVRMFKNRRSF